MGYDGELLEDVAKKIGKDFDTLAYLNNIEKDQFLEPLKVIGITFRNWLCLMKGEWKMFF